MSKHLDGLKVVHEVLSDIASLKYQVVSLKIIMNRQEPNLCTLSLVLPL